MDHDDPAIAAAREDMCRFLAACYYEPAIEFVEEKLFDSLRMVAARLDPVLAGKADLLGECFAAQDLQTLLVDYTRLFLGPVEALAKPYGTCWLAVAELTEDPPPTTVLDLYREGGFDIDETFMELPDHVAVELEFLYLLNFNRNRAQASRQVDTMATLDALTNRFLTEHLGVWIGPFTAAVTDAAQTNFYRQLADLTQCFVQQESARLLVRVSAAAS